MNRPHFRRRPRPVDPEPLSRLDLLSRLDRLDGLPRRVDACDECAALSRAAAVAQEKIDFPLLTIAGLPAEAAPGRTRYDAEWPSVLAAEAPGGDLAAMAAPLPGMARDDLGTYAEPLYPLYQIGPDGIVTVVPEPPDWPRHRDGFIDGDGNPAPVPVKPRGRHRQTDPLDLILADLRDLGGQP